MNTVVQFFKRILNSLFKPDEKEEAPPPALGNGLSLLGSNGLDGEVEELFLDMIDLPTEEREVFLKEWFEKDKDIHRQLLEEWEKNENALDLIDGLREAAFSQAFPSQELSLGEMIGGRYRVGELLGGGAMGKVFSATDSRLHDRKVALKFLKAGLPEKESNKRRFELESLAAANIEHPNVCNIYDKGEHEGQPYLVLEFIEGRSLDGVLEDGVSMNTFLDVVLQIGRGMQAIHQKKIIHRDIKPSNIMVTTSGTVKIMDFGIVKLNDAINNTMDGHTVGTLPYMSPEQLINTNLDVRSDIWSLGVVMYEMLTDARPFQGGFQEIIDAIQHKEPVPVSKLRQDIPSEIEALITRCLSKDPDKRPQSSEDLINQLQHIPNGEGAVTAHKPGIFLCYKNSIEEDDRLAQALYKELRTGFDIKVDQNLDLQAWAALLQDEIEEADYVIALLSEQSVLDEMIEKKLEIAHNALKNNSKPAIIPIRVSNKRSYRQPIQNYLNEAVDLHWMDKGDTSALLSEIKKRLDSDRSHALQPNSEAQSIEVEMVTDFPPGGTMDVQSPFYVARNTDKGALDLIQQGGGITMTIKGPRQSGKSSLLSRVLQHAESIEKKGVLLDFQMMDQSDMDQPDLFFRSFCSLLSEELNIADRTDEFWKSGSGNKQKCRKYFSNHILPSFDGPVVLALDEVDRVFSIPFRNDFFSMLRNWHNSRRPGAPWRRLDLVLVTSTEPYQFIDDLTQSPFNVGETLVLQDLTLEQAIELNERFSSPPLTSDEVEKLTDWVGGLPYLVHRGLYHIHKGEINFEDLISEEVTMYHPIYGDHLRRHGFRLQKNEGQLAMIKAIIDGKSTPQNSTLWRLHGAGLILFEGNKPKIRCKLYEEYFKSL